MERTNEARPRRGAFRAFGRAGVLALTVLVLAPAAVLAIQGDKVEGKGIDGSGNRFSFTATATGAADRANGSFRYTFNDADPNRRVTGDVTCVRIIGNAATIGGFVTNDSFGGELEGQPFVIQVNDEAKPGDGFDDFNFFFLGTVTPPATPCSLIAPTQFEFNIMDGDIEITPAAF
jgi:hypothetical protein